MIDKKIESVLMKLERQAEIENEFESKFPRAERMLAITRDIGLLYNIILRISRAKNILEIGTSVGYSTIWFAEAIRENLDAKIFTIEKDKNKIYRAKKNFEAAGVEKFIQILEGDALTILERISNEKGYLGKFDFVFIDADKERYNQYFDYSLSLVKKGGLIGADNIVYPERFKQMMENYVRHVRTNPKVRSVTIPIDNGEEISLKLVD